MYFPLWGQERDLLIHTGLTGRVEAADGRMIDEQLIGHLLQHLHSSHLEMFCCSSINIDAISNRSLAQTSVSGSYITEHPDCHLDRGDNLPPQSDDTTVWLINITGCSEEKCLRTSFHRSVMICFPCGVITAIYGCVSTGAANEPFHLQNDWSLTILQSKTNKYQCYPQLRCRELILIFPVQKTVRCFTQ